MRNILAAALLGAAFISAAPTCAASYTVSLNLAQGGGTIAAFDTSLGNLASVTGTGVLGFIATIQYTVYPTYPNILVLHPTLNSGGGFSVGGFPWQSFMDAAEDQPFYNTSGGNISGSTVFSRQIALPGFSIDPSMFADDVSWFGFVFSNFIVPVTIGNGTVDGVDAVMSGSVDLLFTYDAFAASVPEPASWAMMCGGFALLGLALRRQRKLSFA